MDIDVQLFTSEELSILALDSVYFDKFLDLVRGYMNKCSENIDKFDFDSFWKIFYHLQYMTYKDETIKRLLKKESFC
jgi:hypothetical protein